MFPFKEKVQIVETKVQNENFILTLYSTDNNTKYCYFK